LKSERLRKNPRRGIGFEEAQEIFERPYAKAGARRFRSNTVRSGWVGQRLYTLIFEVREDEEGEVYHLVTLWKATREERKLYEEHA
jgi:uncharacterized DUF497 family protein